MKEWRITAGLLIATIVVSILHVITFRLFPPERLLGPDSLYATSGPAQLTWLISNGLGLATFIAAILATANSLLRLRKKDKKQ